MNRVLWIGVMGVGLCGGCVPMTDPPPNTASARLRVVHASPDAPAVDVCVEGQVAFADAAFPGATDYAELEAGTYAIRVTQSGAGCGSAAVISADLPLEADDEVTVVALNELSEIEPLVLIDDNTAPTSGNAKVRFVHASPDAPTVDITLTDGTTLFDDASFKEASDYLEVPAGTYDLQVRDETGANVVLALDDVGLGAGRIYTVFAVGFLTGEPALDALVVEDN